MKKVRVLGLSFLLAAAVAVPMTAPTPALAEDNDSALGAQPVSDVQPVAAGLDALLSVKSNSRVRSAFL